MHTLPSSAFAGLVLALAPTAWQSAQATKTALKGLDPVALCGGEEVKGQEDLTVTRFLYTYRFASEDNRKTFAAAPERYEIQLGGGCGSMGPLAGRGDPGRFLVHDGRVYIFASDQCRASFTKAADRYLEPDDPEPKGDAAARARGQELLAKAVSALGGDALRKAPGVEFRREHKVKSGDQERVDTWQVCFVSPERLRLDQEWGAEYRESTVVAGADAFVIGNKGDLIPVHATGRRELERELLRLPWLLLREPQLAAMAVGTGTVGETAVERVAVRRGGATTIFAIDPSSGRILASSYRGRGPRNQFGVMEWSFADFRDAQGITVPFKASLAFDGEAQPRSGREWQTIRFSAVDAARFERPKAK